jgi:hypothetical protein
MAAYVFTEGIVVRKISFILFVAGALMHGLNTASKAATVTIGASKDSSIYSNHVDRGTGGGNALITGTNGQDAPRRALIAFDVAGSVPAGAVIQSVTMTLTLGQLPTSPSETSLIELHRIAADWGEGTTQRQTPPNDSFGGMGQGAPASDGDVTWSARFWGMTPTLWNSPGGDFAPLASTTAVIGQPLDVPYSWPSTAAAVSDVQSWLDDPSTNFGWLLLNADEASFSTFRVFYSRQVRRRRGGRSWRLPMCRAGGVGGHAGVLPLMAPTFAVRRIHPTAAGAGSPAARCAGRQLRSTPDAAVTSSAVSQ